MPLTDAQKEISESNARFKVVAAGRRFGKALSVDTPILTDSGFKKMLDVSVGDKVFSPSGFLVDVISTSEVLLGRNVYRVVFSDGSIIDCDEDHEWFVESKKYRKQYARGANVDSIKRIYTTKEMVEEGVKINRIDGRTESNFSIPNSEPIQMKERHFLFEPYSFGYWLGDGNSGTPQLTIGIDDEAEVVSNFAYPIWKTKSPLLWSFAAKGRKRTSNHGYFKSILSDLGVLNNKHIPEQYFFGSFWQRLSLVQGLMDSDGSVSKSGNCEFTSTNRTLAYNFYRLISTLGIKSTITESDAFLNKRFISKKYRVCFSTDIPVFRLRRKLKRLFQNKRRNDIYRRFIVSIEMIDSVPVKCIEVDSDDHLYLAGETLIPTHNSFLSMSLMARVARYPKSQVWYVTTTYSAAKNIMWTMMKERLKKFGWAKSFHEVALQANLVNGSVISLKGANNPDCASQDTDILTFFGWKRFSDLDETELVATVNPETYELEYQKPTRYIKDWYEGKMYHFESKAIDALVTPNHRFFIESDKGARRFKTLDKVSCHDGIPSPPLWNWKGENPNGISLNDCAFMGMYLADGSVRGNKGGKRPDIDGESYSVTFSKRKGIKGGRKGDVFSKYKEVLDNAGIHYNITKSGLTFVSKEIWEKLFPIGNCYTKYIPEDYKNLPVEHLETLLHYMVLGDGTIGSRFGEIVYYTTSRRLADDVQEIAMKCGYSANLYEKKQKESTTSDGRTITPSHPLWEVCLRRRKTSRFFDSKSKPYFKEVDYSGYVYCVEVPNSTIIIRRNGKACLSGNSLRGIGLDYLVLDEAAYLEERVWTEVLRPTLSDKQGGALFISSPSGRNWFYDLWVAGQDEEEEDWESWQYTTLEGGNVPPEEVEAARRNLDERTFEQEYEARFVTYTGLVYYGFDRNESIVERPYDINQPVHIGMDFNIDPMTATVFQIDEDDGTLFAVDEIEIFGSNTDEMAEEILCRFPESAITIYPDPACVQSRTSAGGRTDLSILQSYGFKCKFRRKHPLIRDRINSVNSALCAADGYRRLLVHKECKKIINAFERHSYKKGTNLPEKGGDGDLSHITDSIGYFVEYLYPVNKQEAGVANIYGV